MIRGISVCMIGVQIYYTVYDRRTRVLYAVAVAVAEYAVAVAGLCCVICRTMLCDMQDYAEYQQDYVIWYTILHYIVYNTSCYVV